MVLRHVCAGLALVATLALAGCCCHSCGCRSASYAPAVVNTAPVVAPAPDPCCAPAVPAYSSPAPCGCASLRK